MTWSLGEIRSLSVKAARGSGMDWGIAEEAGFAVEWLETHGLQGTKALAQYLSKVHRQETFEPETCPLKLGCMISDMNDWAELQNKPVYEPLLLMPFIANTLDNETLVLIWSQNSLTICKSGVACNNTNTLNAEINRSPCLVKAELSNSISNMLNHKTRVSDDAKNYVAILNALAHETYAPSTEESRLAGAGAGLNDND